MESETTKIVGVLTVVLAAIGLFAGNEYFKESNKRQDRQREEDRADKQREKREQEERERPQLAYISGDSGPRADGLTHLKYYNKSPNRNAIISYMTFEVSDPQQLERIERIYPKPQNDIGASGGPYAGAKIDKDEVRFLHGYWHGDSYVFYVYPEFYVEADSEIDIGTCIIDAKLPSMEFIGVLEIAIEDGDADALNGVMLKSHKR